MSSNLESVKQQVIEALLQLEPLFKHHQLTLVARNTNSEVDADLIVSSEDDLRLPAQVLQEHHKREKP